MSEKNNTPPEITPGDRHPDYKGEIAALLRGNLAPGQLRNRLEDYHERDIAEALELLRRDERCRFDRAALTKEAIHGGWVTFSGKYCTEYGIATTAARMASIVLHDEKAVMPASMELCGEYGESGLFAGVPCVLGANGVEQVIELPLTAEEKHTFHQCCEGIRRNMEHLKEL